MTSVSTAPTPAIPLQTDEQVEWECAAAAFKQLAFNYAILLGKTPQDCERDLKTALTRVVKLHPTYRYTQFYDDTFSV